ncbi:MAG: FtsX-like permease family protein [Bryobacteraceae bacterium]
MINKLVFENLKHRPVRTLLSALAIGVQVTMVLTLVGVSQGVLQNSIQQTKGVGADILIRAPGSSIIGSMSGEFPGKILKLAATFPRVKMVTGTLVAPAGGFLNYVTGIDLAGFSAMSGRFRYLQGGPFRHPFDVIIDQVYAEEQHLRVGDTITLLNKHWTVCGVVEPGKLARVMMQIDVLRDLTSAGADRITVGYAKLDEGTDVHQEVALFKARLGDYRIDSMEDLVSLTSINSIPILKNFIHIVVGLAVLIGFLVVFLSMYTAVLERTREIGVLKALGASPGYILNILMRETTLLAMAGSAIGILLTYGTKWLIEMLVPSMPQLIVYDWWPIAAAISLVGAWVGAIYPGLKAARQDAIEALSYE